MLLRITVASRGRARASQQRVQPRADDGREVGEGVGLASVRALAAASAPGEGLEVGAGRGAAHRQERHVLGVQGRHDLGVDGTEAEVSKGCEWVRPVLWVEVTPGDSTDSTKCFYVC